MTLSEVVKISAVATTAETSAEETEEVASTSCAEAVAVEVEAALAEVASEGAAAEDPGKTMMSPSTTLTTQARLLRQALNLPPPTDRAGMAHPQEATQAEVTSNPNLMEGMTTTTATAELILKTTMEGAATMPPLTITNQPKIRLGIPLII